MPRLPGPFRGRKYLLNRRYPLAYCVFNGSLALAKGLTHEQKVELEAKVRAYDAELNALSDEEIQRLETEEREREVELAALKREQEEKQRSFNQPAAKADYGYWSKMTYWSLDEAVALLLERDPRAAPWVLINPLVQVSDFAKRFSQIREILLRACYGGVFGNQNAMAPAGILAWAKNIGLEVPQTLVEHVERHIGEIPDKARYSRTISALSEAQLALGDLQRENRGEPQYVKDNLKKVHIVRLFRGQPPINKSVSRTLMALADKVVDLYETEIRQQHLA